MNEAVLLVFSRHRWHLAMQRTQHLALALAERWKVLFVEPASTAVREPYLELEDVAPGVDLITPRLPAAAPGRGRDAMLARQVKRMLMAHLSREGLQPSIVWLDTPMALPLAEGLGASCMVYDCIDTCDPITTSPLFRLRESALIERADLVLANGPTLYQARRERYDHVVCVPSAVDAAHFAPAGLDRHGFEARQAQALQGDVPGPRLGWFGLIEPRLDLRLVARLAEAHRGWSLIMAGPLDGVDPAALPQGRNLHWLGAQPYERLPHLLAGWDVALLPYALNPGTRLFNPPQTLEYLAGEKPVVGSALPNVISLHGHAVETAADADAFVQACARVLDERPVDRCRRMHAAMSTVMTQSWRHSAAAVHEMILATLAHAHPHQGAHRAAARLLQAAMS